MKSGTLLIFCLVCLVCLLSRPALGQAGGEAGALDRWTRQVGELTSQADAAGGAAGADLDQRLEQAADELHKLAGELSGEPALTAANLELRIRQALVQTAQRRGDTQIATSRLSRWRSAAVQAQQKSGPGAQTLGQFWLLQSDLLETQLTNPQPRDCARRSINLLEQYLQNRPDDQSAISRSLTRQIKLALLQLYDQEAQSKQAARFCQQLQSEAAGKGEGNAELRKFLGETYGWLALLGRPFSAQLDLGNDQKWRSEDQKGKVLLLHFFADWWPGSAQSFQEVAAAQKSGKNKGLSILSVGLADGGGGSEPLAVNVPWPIYREGPKRVSLSKAFQVRNLPRFVLISPDGTITAAGSSLSILDQAQKLLEGGRK